MPINHDPLHPTLTLNSSNPLHKNIILTPPSPSDALPKIPAMNHPSIYLYLTGPPFPYTHEANESFYTNVLDRTARIAIAELWDAHEAEIRDKAVERNGKGEGKNWKSRKWVEAVPFPSIREVVYDEEGKRQEIFIGQADVRRRGYTTFLDGGERERLVKRNAERRTGDPEIEWEIGFFLLPSHHGRSIMPAVLQTLITDFFIPYMNAHRLEGEYLEYNGASRRVFEKCGFVFHGVTEEVEAIVEGKREALRELLEKIRRGGNVELAEKGQKWLSGGKVGIGGLSWSREGEREGKGDEEG